MNSIAQRAWRGLALTILALIVLSGCGGAPSTTPTLATTPSAGTTPSTGTTLSAGTTPLAAPSPSVTSPGPYADVTAVTVSGEPGAYQFAVTVRSPDTGCEQFADWWEILSEDGQLLYRRVLLHSHVDEQPFTRSGGPVDVTAETVVIVRAHMSEGGYGGVALRGSAAGGFEPVELEPGFAADVAEMAPLPEGCGF